MKAIFANLTLDNIGAFSRPAPAAATRQRVYALFDETQLAIHDRDHP
jgi:hypothetical protein